MINFTGTPDNFTHFTLAITLFCLPHLYLNLIPLQPQLHVSPVLKVTESYGWQELLMQVRGGGIGNLWRGSPAPPPDYFQSLGSHLPASCSLLEHLNWVSRMRSNSFSPFLPTVLFTEEAEAPFCPGIALSRWYWLLAMKSFVFMHQL